MLKELVAQGVELILIASRVKSVYKINVDAEVDLHLLRKAALTLMNAWNNHVTQVPSVLIFLDLINVTAQQAL